jgi:hypothetical protein
VELKLLAASLQPPQHADVQSAAAFDQLQFSGNTRDTPQEEQAAPDIYVCPITMDVMHDPVVAADG